LPQILEVRGLEREQLALLLQSSFDLGKRRARPRGNYELGWLVGHNAAQRRSIENVAPDFTAIEILGSAAANAQGPPPRRRVTNQAREIIHNVLHKHA